MSNRISIMSYIFAAMASLCFAGGMVILTSGR